MQKLSSVLREMLSVVLVLRQFVTNLSTNGTATLLGVENEYSGYKLRARLSKNKKKRFEKSHLMKHQQLSFTPDYL